MSTAPLMVRTASSTATSESERWNRCSFCGDTRIMAVSRSERRISMLMKVAMAITVNRQKVSRNMVSTVRTAAASTIRNDSTAR